MPTRRPDSCSASASFATSKMAMPPPIAFMKSRRSIANNCIGVAREIRSVPVRDILVSGFALMRALPFVRFDASAIASANALIHAAPANVPVHVFDDFRFARDWRLLFSSATPPRIIPDVQYAHCIASTSINACCTGCSSPFFSRPSMVVICRWPTAPDPRLAGMRGGCRRSAPCTRRTALRRIRTSCRSGPVDRAARSEVASPSTSIACRVPLTFISVTLAMRILCRGEKPVHGLRANSILILAASPGQSQRKPPTRTAE